MKTRKWRKLKPIYLRLIKLYNNPRMFKRENNPKRKSRHLISATLTTCSPIKYHSILYPRYLHLFCHDFSFFYNEDLKLNCFWLIYCRITRDPFIPLFSNTAKPNFPLIKIIVPLFKRTPDERRTNKKELPRYILLTKSNYQTLI